MISFDKNNLRFTYRVAAVFLHNNHVLLNREHSGHLLDRDSER